MPSNIALFGRTCAELAICGLSVSPSLGIFATMNLKRIVMSNDDGIHAPGIRTFHDAIKDLAEIEVVAPSDEQSAVGHSITIFDPIKTRKVSRDGEDFGLAVGGTPADCVKLAICELCDEPPDMVVSGINLGPNIGISVLYSGTVSAATEATILGIPSIAVSLCTYFEPQWETAATVARRIVEKALASDLPPNTLLNVNIPNLPIGDIKGTRVAPIARSRFKEMFHKRTDPRGNLYYWLDGELEMLENDKETDVGFLWDGYVTITPINFDLTDYDALASFDDWTAV